MSQSPWFRARARGLGWTPATWQGWVVTLVGVLAAMAANLALVACLSRVRN